MKLAVVPISFWELITCPHFSLHFSSRLNCSFISGAQLSVSFLLLVFWEPWTSMSPASHWTCMESCRGCPRQDRQQQSLDRVSSAPTHNPHSNNPACQGPASPLQLLTRSQNGIAIVWGFRRHSFVPRPLKGRNVILQMSWCAFCSN